MLREVMDCVDVCGMAVGLYVAATDRCYRACVEDSESPNDQLVCAFKCSAEAFEYVLMVYGVMTIKCIEEGKFKGWAVVGR